LGNFDLAVKAAMMLLHPQPPVTSSSLLHFVLESANKIKLKVRVQPV